MNRTTLTQAVALLVMLWAAFRWLPGDFDEPDEVLGRGDIDRMLYVDDELWAGRHSPLSVQSQARAMSRGFSAITRGRYIELLKCARAVKRVACPGDLIQFKGMPGNDAYILQYYLYPLRTTAYYSEHGSRGDDPTRPDAMFVIQSTAIGGKWWETGASRERRAAGDAPCPEVP